MTAALATPSDLLAERDRLRRLLVDGDRWLTEHPDATDYEQRELKWLGWLSDYCGIEDDLDEARASL